MTASLNSIVKKSRFPEFGGASKTVDWSWSPGIKSHCSQTCPGKWATIGRIPMVKPLLNSRTTEEASDLGYGKEALDSCRVVQSPLFRRKQVLYVIWKSRRPESGERLERSKIQVAWIQCEVPTVSDGLGSHVSCWCWSTVFHQVQSKCSCVPRDLEHYMLPSAEKLYGDDDFIFQHDLAPAHSAKTTSKWCTDHGITVLDWPANSPDLNPIENLWGIVKKKQKDTRPYNANELKAAIEGILGIPNTSAMPQADCLHATPHWCSNPCKRIPNQVLSALMDIFKCLILFCCYKSTLLVYFFMIF